MAGDLEDFLRRAAQRRATNAAAKAEERQRQQHNARPLRPEYTDRSRERGTTIPPEDPDDDIVVATLASDVQRPANAPPPSIARVPPSIARVPPSIARVEQTGGSHSSRLRTTFDHEGSKADSSTQLAPPAAQGPAVNPTTEALFRLLLSPHGVRQAVLLREILDRPTHRW